MDLLFPCAQGWGCCQGRADRQTLGRAVALFGVLFLGEELTMPNWLGVALIAVGAILIAYR
jgi:hypothetical protein